MILCRTDNCFQKCWMYDFIWLVVHTYVWVKDIAGRDWRPNTMYELWGVNVDILIFRYIEVSFITLLSINHFLWCGVGGLASVCPTIFHLNCKTASQCWQFMVTKFYLKRIFNVRHYYLDTFSSCQWYLPCDSSIISVSLPSLYNTWSPSYTPSVL